MPDRRRVQAPTRLPARHRAAVRARRRLPVDPVRIGRRRAASTPPISRAARSSCRPATSPTSSPTSQPVGTVVLTTLEAIQQAAADALGGQQGSVVALDVKTGGGRRRVLEPHVRPEPAREPRHEERAEGVRRAMLLDATEPAARPRRGASSIRPAQRSRPSPRRSRSTNNVDVDKQFPVVRQIPLPQTTGIPAQLRRRAVRRDARARASSSRATRRSGRSASTSATASRPACRTSAWRPRRRTPADRVSIRRSCRAPGPSPARSSSNQPTFAQAAIGQNAVAVTPLEMALVAEVVATGGIDPQPPRSSSASWIPNDKDREHDRHERVHSGR